MEYVIELLKRHLKNERRVLAIGKDFDLKNELLKFNLHTQKAFDKSNRLAKERIPQLKKAIKQLTQTKGE